MNLFLKAKHWQLFIALVGIPMIFQFVMMGVMITSFMGGGSSELLPGVSFLLFFPIMMMVLIGLLLGWFWSIAIGLQTKVPADIKMKVTKFKIFLFTPLIYMSVIMLALATSIATPFETPGVFALIIPIHLFSMFCMFYCLYFVAKTIKTVELQREVKFDDFAAEFFLMWFYPIGIWIVQPKINKMVE